MKAIIENILSQLEASGNFRKIPEGISESCVDFTSNDYLGLARRNDIQEAFLNKQVKLGTSLTSSASRLLAGSQQSYSDLENDIATDYGHNRKALIFNSGYHANTGLIAALAQPGVTILADKLVHASIIDGIKLSGAPFARFRHNDATHLDRLASKAYTEGNRLLIIAESVYSMDGDFAPIDDIIEVKKKYPGSMLYIDEAHAVGVVGRCGLGLACDKADVDVIVGTFGKALASVGAYAVMSPELRDFAINKARSLIFSTAIPPINVEWTRVMWDISKKMNAERLHLSDLGRHLASALSQMGFNVAPSHIIPITVGSSDRAVALSRQLRNEGFEVLPIRTPTVPPGTERLRVSLSAAHSITDISRLINSLQKILQ